MDNGLILHVDGVYHTCWKDDLKANVFQRKLLGWGSRLMLFLLTLGVLSCLIKKIDPKCHYDNYCKDMQCLEYYGCSYTTYVTHIIDFLCHHDDSYGVEYPDDDCSHSGVRTFECRHQLTSLPLCHSDQGRGLDPKL